MITDEDLTPIDLSDFWEDDRHRSRSPQLQMIEPDYINVTIASHPAHTAMIPGIGWHPISICLKISNPDGSLTAEQRQAVDNFAIGYQYQATPTPTPTPRWIFLSANT
jgi:hypothetical protein